MNATWLARLPLNAKDWLDLLALRWLVVLRRFWRFCGLNEKLRGQNQFPLRGDAQTVFTFVVFDHDFLRRTEQVLAADVGRGAAGPLGRTLLRPIRAKGFFVRHASYPE